MNRNRSHIGFSFAALTIFVGLALSLALPEPRATTRLRPTRALPAAPYWSVSPGTTICGRVPPPGSCQRRRTHEAALEMDRYAFPRTESSVSPRPRASSSVGRHGRTSSASSSGWPNRPTREIRLWSCFQVTEARQPESIPPDPVYPEPDGIDEIFLPADVGTWKSFPERVPNAIVDNEIGVWLRAIAAKRAFVWVIFDCCHSGTMTRGIEVVRELPPGTLVPSEELTGPGSGRPAAWKDRGQAAAEALRPCPTAGRPITWLPSTPVDRTNKHPRARNPRQRLMPSITACSPTHWWISSQSRRPPRHR